MHAVARTIASASVVNIDPRLPGGWTLTIVVADLSQNAALRIESQKTDGDRNGGTKHGCKNDAVRDRLGGMRTDRVVGHC